MDEWLNELSKWVDSLPPDALPVAAIFTFIGSALLTMYYLMRPRDKVMGQARMGRSTRWKFVRSRASQLFDEALAEEWSHGRMTLAEIKKLHLEFGRSTGNWDSFPRRIPVVGDPVKLKEDIIARRKAKGLPLALKRAEVHQPEAGSKGPITRLRGSAALAAVLFPETKRA